MRYQITYDVDYSALHELAGYVQQALGENSSLIEAVQFAGDYAVQEWIKTASTKFKHSQGGYARGILSGVSYPFAGDPLHFRIEHKERYAKALEDGYSSFDLKKALQTSQKVRMSKEGKLYLIIPFRHGIPGTKSFRAMPKDVYENAPIGTRVVDATGRAKYEIDSERAGARNMRQSVTSGTFKEGSIRGSKTLSDAELMKNNNPDKVIRNKYVWADRLMGVDQPKLKEHHKTNIYEGMVRFQANPNVNREALSGKFAGAQNPTDFMGNYSTYMTFRVMQEDSPGWIHPGIRPMNILGETMERIRGTVIQIMADGAKKDFEKFKESVQ